MSVRHDYTISAQTCPYVEPCASHGLNHSIPNFILHSFFVNTIFLNYCVVMYDCMLNYNLSILFKCKQNVQNLTP